MVLHTECGQGLVRHSLNGVVIEVDMRDFDLVGIETIGIDGKSMILSRNLHAVFLDVQHRMIPAVMAEFQLERPAAKRQPHDLMPETDAENGLLSEKTADVS